MRDPAASPSARRPERAALEAALATARATVATLEAALAAEATAAEADELLDLPALKERFQLGRAAVLGAVARGELVASRGSRGRILVARSSVEAWLGSRPVTAAKRVARTAPTDLAAWEAKQERELERAARAGGRR